MNEQEKYKAQFKPAQWERLIKLSEFRQAWDSGNLEKAGLFSDRLLKTEPKVLTAPRKRKLVIPVVEGLPGPSGSIAVQG